MTAHTRKTIIVLARSKGRAIAVGVSRGHDANAVIWARSPGDLARFASLPVYVDLSTFEPIWETGLASWVEGRIRALEAARRVATRLARAGS